jgi:hypothetical protein
MTLDAPETTPPTPDSAPLKKSPVAGNIVFILSSFVTTIACCLCAVAVAAVSPSAFTTVQNYQATQAGISIVPLDAASEERNATATVQADTFSDLQVSREMLDTFDRTSERWLTGTYEDDFALTDYDIEDGKYTWDVETYQGVILRVPYPTAYLADFYVSAELEVASEADDAQYGLIFRDNTEDYYIFMITGNYEFTVYLYKNGFWQLLLEPVATTHLVADDVNRLTVVGQGTHFDFYINNEHVADMDDGALPVGRVGLAVGLQHAEETGLFKFDNFEIRVLNPAEDFEIPELAPTRTPSP